MTYIVDFAKNLSQKRNIGLLIYLALNTYIIAGVLSDGFKYPAGVLAGIGAYILSLAIALSPIGEWVLRKQNGCRPIVRKEHATRLDPLFRETLARARKLNPSIPSDVKLFINDSRAPHAFATGRKTICLSKGFLEYPDEQIKAIFAHELAHLGNKDTDLILLVGVGNFIITAMFILYRAFFYVVSLGAAVAHRSFAPVLLNFFVDVMLVGMMSLWTKFGLMLVRHSSRQNEYLADKFAFDCGYGPSLALALDTLDSRGAKGLWASLLASHPNNDLRIARLQELGEAATQSAAGAGIKEE